MTHARLRRPALLLSAAVLLAAIGAAAAAPVAADGPVRRWVDGDGAAGPSGCGGAAPAATTVSAAVDASGPGDTVIVCPGTYVEQVLVRGDRDGLTIRAASPWSARIVAPPALDAMIPFPSSASVAGLPTGITSIVGVRGVDGVTIRGLAVIAPTQAPCTIVDFGILVTASTGAQVRGNRVRARGDATLGPCGLASGIAIVDAFPWRPSAGPVDGAIAFNLVEDFAYDGIAAVGYQARTTVRITRNSVRYEHGPVATGTSVTRARTVARVLGSRSPAGALLPEALPPAYGVTVVGRAQVQVTRNAIRSAEGATLAPQDGPFVPVLDRAVFLAARERPVRAGVIRHNRIMRATTGVHVEGGTDLAIGRNAIRNTRTGLDLDLTASTIDRNVIRSRDTGVALSGDSAGNRLTRNVAGGGTRSCLDPSTGGGTAGTANRWRDNIATASPSDPVGLCAQP